MRINQKKLKNGLRVITVPMKDTPTVTALVMVEAGSKYEDKENNGISHFLEHMCFQGTEKRPEPGQISYELEKMGADHNAFTSHEYTGYFAKGQSKHTEKILELVADLYLNPIFPEEAVKKEKGVIIEEINMYEDLPQRRAMELLMNLMYKNQPAGMDILGTKKNIRQMKREDFVTYHSNHYLPSSTVVVIAGNIDNKKVTKQVADLFADAKKGKKGTKKSVRENQKSPSLLLSSKKTDQSHIALGIRAFDVHHKDTPVLSLIACILGQGLSSRLFKRMRNELGMCYYTSAFTDLFTDHGYFGVRTGVGHKRTLEAVEVILEEIKRFKDELVPSDELQKAKDLKVGTMYLGLEGSDDLALYCGVQDVLGLKVKNLKDKEKELRKVTVQDVQRVAKKIFTKKNLNLAVVGPYSGRNKSQFNKILKV